MSVLGPLIGLILIVAVLSPFFLGAGGLLAPGSQINSADKLRAIKQALLDRYLEDEAAHKRGDLSDAAWRKRQEFLVHRYVDAARRLDFLEGQQGTSAGGAA